MKIYKRSDGVEESIYADVDEAVANKNRRLSFFIIMKENRWL